MNQPSTAHTTARPALIIAASCLALDGVLAVLLMSLGGQFAPPARSAGDTSVLGPALASPHDPKDEARVLDVRS